MSDTFLAGCPPLCLFWFSNSFGGNSMNTLISSDVEVDVEAAFQEMECIFGTKKPPHGGDRVAYFDGHGCCCGFICQSHMDYYLSVYRPAVQMAASGPGGGFCEDCKMRFYSVDEHHKVYPL